MKRGGYVLTAGLVVGLSISALAAQEVKDKGDTSPLKSKPDPKLLTKEKLATAGVLSGTLVKLDEDKKFTLKVTYYDIDPAKVQNHQQHYLRRLAEINQNWNLVQAQQQLAQLQVDMAQRSQDIYKKMNKDINLQAEDNVKVRSLKPLVAFDNKGEIIEYSKEDLKKMTADSPKLPGVGLTFAASFDKLQPQQKIIAYLAKSKAPAQKGQGAAAGDISQPRPRVVAIVISSEVNRQK
jgi:hypothetical protein